MKEIKAVILDFDGTLLDSYSYGFKHLGWIAERYGFSLTADIRQKMLETWGHTGIEFLQSLFGIDEAVARRMYLDWEALDTEDPIPLVSGAMTTLQWFREQTYTACVLTSRHRKTVMSILARERLHDYFARITAREDSNFTKPDRRAFIGILQTLARQKVCREECLFVGDTFIDIEAGRNVGINTVVVETGPYRHEHHKTHPVPEDHVIPSIANLPSWIQSAH